MEAAANFKVCVVGSFTHDQVFSAGRKFPLIGGAVTYTGLTLSVLGCYTTAIFRLCPDDTPSMQVLQATLGKCIVHPTEQTTSFVNEEKADGSRTQRMLAKSRPIAKEMIVDLPVQDWIHVSPLYEGDVDLEACRQLRFKTAQLSLDVQGFCRIVRGDAVEAGRSPLASSFLELADWVKASQEEWDLLSADISPTAFIQKWGLKGLLCTKGNEGGWLQLNDGNRYDYAAIDLMTAMPEWFAAIRLQTDSSAINAGFETGAGDVFMGGWIAAHLQGLPYADCLQKAALIAALQVSGRHLEASQLQY